MRDIFGLGSPVPTGAANTTKISKFERVSVILYIRNLIIFYFLVYTKSKIFTYNNEYICLLSLFPI